MPAGGSLGIDSEVEIRIALRDICHEHFRRTDPHFYRR
jgi:hypothetical protein